MRTNVSKHALVASLAVAVLAPADAAAQAEQPKFEYGERDEDQKKLEDILWTAQMQAGLVHTSGNSRTTTFSGGGSATRSDPWNKLKLDASTAYVRSEIFVAADEDGDGFIGPDEIDRQSQTTARSWAVQLRYDRFLTEHNSLYATALLSADEPAGKELVGGAQGGYSRRAYATETHEVVAEVGYDFTYERYVDQDGGTAIHSGRFFGGYTGNLREDTSVNGSVETLVNINSLDTPGGPVDTFEDTRVNARAELTTKLWEDVSFSFSFTAKYDHAPSPRPAFDLPYEAGFVPLADELDTITKAQLIINLM